MPIQRAKPKLTDIRGGTPLTTSSTLTTSNMPAGSIVQVQNVKTNTKTTTTSDSMGDVSNLTLSFTPLFASSTLKITASVQFKNQRNQG